jgi:hypothetical protein
MAHKLRAQEEDENGAIPALRCAFEWVSEDFGVTEGEFSLHNLVAEVVLECAKEGLCEPLDIRTRAHSILRSRSH